MAYRIALCDDAPADRAYMEKRVKLWAEERAVSAAVETFPSAEAFLFRWEEMRDWDILLLDIEMGDMDGVTLAKKLRQLREGAQIVFVTGYPDFAAEGYEVDALHYLMKPVSDEKLFAVLDRAVQRLERAAPTLLVTAEGQTHRLPVDSILYVEAFAHTCRLTTVSEVLEVRMNFSRLEKQLGAAFVRCHRSYLAGLKYVRAIGREQVTMDDGSLLPLARNRWRTVNDAFLAYYRGELQ